MRSPVTEDTAKYLITVSVWQSIFIALSPAIAWMAKKRIEHKLSHAGCWTLISLGEAEVLKFQETRDFAAVSGGIDNTPMHDYYIFLTHCGSHYRGLQVD